MKAIVLEKYGDAFDAFETREINKPVPSGNQVLIKVEVSGLNFADVLARRGLYKDAPPLPAILGYEVVGRIEAWGAGVSHFERGQSVLAFTRFGGYAEYVLTDDQAVIPIPENVDPGVAAAIATQYSTAYYGAYELLNLFEGDHVLIHAAAGGVGTALVQLAKNKGCKIWGTAGSDEKLEYLRRQGVDYPINYKKADFYDEIRKIRGKQGVHVVFDSIGGSVFKKSLKLLSYGGKIVSYGAAERVGGKWGKLSTLKLAWDYGFIHPAFLLMTSRSVIGLNMLRIADYKPGIIQRCLQELLLLLAKGKINPSVGAVFPASQVAEAHWLLESRKSTGKIIIKW